jgi:hypothetical protein
MTKENMIRKALILPEKTWKEIEEIRFSGRYKSELDCLRDLINFAVVNYSSYSLIKDTIYGSSTPSVELPIKKEKKEKVKKEKKEFLDADFESFWLQYPRKTAKPAAKKAWQGAMGKTTADVILKALPSFSFSVDPNFIPHPATWLNNERWNDVDTGQQAREKSYWEMTQAEREAFDAAHLQRLQEQHHEV